MWISDRFSFSRSMSLTQRVSKSVKQDNSRAYDRLARLEDQVRVVPPHLDLLLCRDDAGLGLLTEGLDDLQDLGNCLSVFVALRRLLKDTLQKQLITKQPGNRPVDERLHVQFPGIRKTSALLDEPLECRVVGHLVVNAVGGDGVVRNVLHVRFAKVEHSVVDGGCNTADGRVLFALNLMEGIEHLAVVHMQLAEVVEDVVNELSESFS